LPGKKRTSNHVTLADVAKASGFSASTVSIVLNEAPLSRYVAAKTKEHIRKTAQKLGYHPDAFARSLRRRRSNTIGVMAFDLSDPFCIPIVRGVEKDSTKTNVARQVILNSRALGALKSQAEHTRIAAKHVFLDPRYGEPWREERAFRRSYWTPALKALGIRYRKPYNMRHTYATMMLMAGMTPAFCAKQLGHSVEMFLGTYAKWLDGGQNDVEMARMEAALGRNSGKKSGKGRGA